LPITIPEPRIALDGKQPPRLKTIGCFNSSGYYTIGNALHIYLEYYAPVIVQGNPAILLNTGCHSSACFVPEIQSFVCRASRGMFSMKVAGVSLMNIAVNTTADQLARYLRSIPGIYNVSVVIVPGLETDFLTGKQVCSVNGNTVYLYFYGVDLPEYNGDLPAITLNPSNNDPDSRSGISQVRHSILCTLYILLYSMYSANKCCYYDCFIF
jgi:hypothetical protein